MEEINLYGTHIEYLQRVFEFTGKLDTVIEYGMGDYSTEVIIENAANAISIEMQSDEWYQKMVNKFGNKINWSHYYLYGPMEFLNIEYPSKIDFAFVDGHGDSRPECINYMMKNRCPIIVSHDTEEPGYGWDRVVKNDYKRIDFKKYTNWTSLWTNNDSLYNTLSND